MMVKRNRIGILSRSILLAIVLVLAIGLFCGTGVAATNMGWSSYTGATNGDITITDASGSTLSHKTTLTISQDAVLDFGDAKTYSLTGSTSAGGCGGLVDNLVFSDTSKVLTIKNIHIISSGVIDSSDFGIGGLFGRIESTGTLILENCSINGVTIIGPVSSSYSVGGLIGSASGIIELINCTIENCNISSGGYDVGGLVGFAYAMRVNISGCRIAFSNVTSGSSLVGGLVGAVSSMSLNMSGCVVDRVYVEGSDNSVGGLVGRAFANSVVNCANAIVNGSEVTSSSYSVGGLVGAVYYASMNMSGCMVEECTVWSSSSNLVGGLVGYAYSASLNMSGCMVEECTVWSSSSNCVGGLVGSAGSASIGLIGDSCWVNESWVSGTSEFGSLVGYSYPLSPLVAPRHSAVYSASTTTGSSVIANNDFDGIGTKEQYGSPIDRYGLIPGNDYGYGSYKPGVVDSGICGDNLTWVLTDDGTLTISGTGAMYDYEYQSVPWSSYRSQLTNLVISEGLTRVGNYAFIYCTNLTGSLTIPKSVTEIGNVSFKYCNGFTGSLILPDGLTKLGFAAFEGCNNFSGNLVLPTNLTIIDDWVFGGCSGFTGTLDIPENVTEIGMAAFQGCNGFTGSLILPEGLRKIGEAAFNSCWSFTGSLAIPSTVNEIGELAFQDCGFTGTVTIPASVTKIGDGAFRASSRITGFVVVSANPNYSSDNQGIIYNKDKTTIICCPNGKTGTVVIPNTVTIIENSSFANCKYCTGSLNIPACVRTIGMDAFCGCSGFTGSLIIPNNVTVIEDWAFSECRGFTGALIVPSNVTKIGRFAFESCEGLTSVTVPKSTSNIGEGAFQKSGNITLITFQGSIPPTIDEAAFANVNATGVITVPEGKTAEYTQALTNKGVVIDANHWVINEEIPSSGLKLYLGWNVISTPKKLSSAYDTAAELFAGVNTTGHAVLTYNAQTKNWEQVTASTKIEPLNAYWIYSNESKNLPYEFSSTVSSPAVKRVYSGWNAVSLSADDPMSAADTFGNINWYTYLEWNAASQAFKSALIKGGSGTHADTNLVSLWTGGWLFLNEDGTYMGFTA